MKVRNSISPQIIEAVVNLMKPSVPELTPTTLIAALQNYNPEAHEQEEVNARSRQPYTIQEVCQLFRVSRPTIYALEKSGKLIFIKVGRSTRIPAESVDSLLGK